MNVQIARFVQPSELTEPFIQGYYRTLEEELKALPANPSDWIAFVSRWNAFKAYLSGENSRRSLRESQNTQDAEAEKAAAFMRDKIAPLQEEHDAVIRQAVLASPCRPALEEHFGKLLFVNWEVAQSAFDPKNIALNTEIANLTARYSKVVGSAKMTVDGEELTLPHVLALLEHPREAKRKAAWEAVNAWTYAHGEELQSIYSKLVELRQKVALNLKETNFVPVGYKRMQRTDYGPAEVKRFREEIKRSVVPLLYRFRKKQAESLGQTTVKPWNMKYYPGMSLDPKAVKVEEELTQAQKVFDRLHPHLGKRFETMRIEKLIDLENRPGKVPGAFCTNFDDTKKAFIFCNSTGSSEDIATLTHEMGHAFQIWDSMWIEPIELRWPTYEACEIHSTGMEYLALPLLDEFFRPEDAKKFRKLRMIDTLTMLPYIATVDEYQHWVYEHPGHTPAERDAAWDRIWDSYNVGLDFTGVEAAKAVRWKRQNHIFMDPFYYIDYAIAEAGALQLFLIDQNDHAKAMESYMTLCQIGGSQSLLQIFETGGLKSPFTPGLFRDLMDKVAQELEL
ncbi:MAG: M3 family oligoendopeptidase [Bacteroidota bacterium]